MIAKNIFLVATILFSAILSAQDKAGNYIKEGNKQYMISSYDEAGANYLRAVQEDKKSFKANYNLGNAMYQLKKYDTAISQFEKSTKLASEKKEQSMAYFNAGDSYYKKKDFAKAAEAFKNALKLNPSDDEARYNYALAKQKLKQQQQNRQQDDKNQQNSSQNNNQNNNQNRPDSNQAGQNQSVPNNSGNSGGQNQNRSGQGQGNENQTQSIKNQPDNPSENQQQNGQRQYYDGILEAMSRQEQQAQQKIINKKIPSADRQRDKDW